MSLHHLANLRNTAPLVHCLACHVTSNEVANLLLAAGAQPIMAEDICDIKHITPAASALYISLGTLRRSGIRERLVAARLAKKAKIPVVLDPVGAGCSPFRLKAAKKLIQSGAVSIVRGNGAEIEALITGEFTAKGVDSFCSVEDIISAAAAYSEKHGLLLIISGKEDYVIGGKAWGKISNGHPLMRRITGMGCMLSGLTAAFAAASGEDLFSAATAALCTLGICGERAAARLGENMSAGTFRRLFFDEISLITDDILKESSRYEIC